MITAFDADVLIYAAVDDDRGRRIASLFDTYVAGVGSVLLLTEVLAKPLRTQPDSALTRRLVALMSRVELLPLDEATGQLALAFAVAYGLRAADAAHLATAVAGGADRFLTNNRRDFPDTIAEIDIVYPEDLATGADR